MTAFSLRAPGLVSLSGSVGASGDVNTGLPAWVPAEGHFKNLGSDSLLDVAPTGWPNGDNAGPFANWSSAAFVPDFGTYGAILIHGSGHLSADTPLWAGVWLFDCGAHTWTGRNVPAAPLLEGASYYNSYGESNQTATLGHAYPQHSYDGLIVQRASLGGGTNGSLWRVQAAGQTYTHKFDLSSATDPPTRPFDAMPGGNGYPMTALDEGRGGFWSLNNNGGGDLYFIDFDTESATSVGDGYSSYGDNSLIYIPAPYDCLLGMGRANMAGTLWKYFVATNLDGSPSFTEITANITGTAPDDARAGGQWSTLLGCVISKDSGGTYTIHKLTPPADPADVLTDPWAWTSETLVGDSGAVPSECAVSGNGAYGRLIEVPSLHCCFWVDSVGDLMQAWRLTGM